MKNDPEKEEEIAPKVLHGKEIGGAGDALRCSTLACTQTTLMTDCLREKREMENWTKTPSDDFSKRAPHLRARSSNS